MTIVVVCVLNFSIEFVSAVGFLNQYSAQRAVADYLRDHIQPGKDARIFCDEGTVRVLSGIPPETFLTSSDTPRDREDFLVYLRQKNVEYLAFINKEGSTAAKLFPELTNGTGNEIFQPVMHSSSRFLRTDIWLYRVRKIGAVSSADLSGRACRLSEVDEMSQTKSNSFSTSSAACDARQRINSQSPKILTSSDAPRDSVQFQTFLKEENVEYLVFVNKEDSTLAKLLPELGNGGSNEIFEPGHAFQYAVLAN